MGETGTARLVGLARHPVKAMAGESLTDVEVDARGLVGDRWFAVEDAAGRFAAGKDTRRFRRRDPVLQYAAATTPDGVRVTGAGGSWRVGDRQLDAWLSREVGCDVRVLPEGAVDHQDAGRVSLVSRASLAWCAEHLGVDADPRRVRTNLLLDGLEAFAEEEWVGHEVAVGEVVLRVVDRVERCRVVDLAQNGLTGTTRLLKGLAATRDLRLAVYADVVVPGRLTLGDAVVPRPGLVQGPGQG